MIRLVAFLVSVALLAAGVAWVADRPGDIAVNWMGYHIETSVLVAALALLVLVIAAIVLWSILRGIWRSPQHVSLFFRHRRAMKGYLAVSRGLVAIGAGDHRLARKSADEAARLSPNESLTLLLTAQSAQLAGDRAGAEGAFRAMLRREETRLLGLRGLFVEAQRRDDAPAALHAAEEAARVEPSLTWAGHAVIRFRSAARDWRGALEALERMKNSLEKHIYRRKRAVLLTAHALAVADTDREASHASALEAVKLAPDLVPAAALAGRRLAEAGEARKAGKILSKAWAANPHPDIAEAYANLRFGDSARERLARVKRLVEKLPGHVESALALARAALDARDFTAARAALASHLAAPTRRIATLMAEIEEAEHGDKGRVREWMARAMRAAGDPAWTAEGVVSDRWMPVTPKGHLDGFEWKPPLAEIGVSPPVIEVSEPAPQPTAAPEAKPPEAMPPQPELKPEPKPVAQAKPVEAVIPLVHAPDDPGPDPGPESDPVAETAAPPARDTWQRIRQLFR
ncbi:MAG TPA: heme biosynthesis HemY N-terminal domain-containing protein [Pseudolabrys sp.]|nr:heme biosynthesis HemY N-terminal domain-containing protein [Pseudolabrys sp.]